MVAYSLHIALFPTTLYIASIQISVVGGVRCTEKLIPCLLAPSMDPCLKVRVATGKQIRQGNEARYSSLSVDTWV